MLPSLAGLALHTDAPKTDLEKAKYKFERGLRLTNEEDALLMEDEILQMYERREREAALESEENDNMSDSDYESDMNEYYLDWRVAVRDGDVERVREWIQSGGKVNKTNKYGSTPLMEAAKNNQVAVVELLLESGADIDKANKNGETALMEATEMSNVAVVKLLLDRGADPNKATSGGDTALIEAVMVRQWWGGNGNAELVKLLIQHGADVNQANMHGSTAVTLASSDEIRRLLRDAYNIRWRYLEKDFKPPMRGKRGGSGFYQAEHDYEERAKRFNPGNTSMSFSDFLSARMRGSARRAPAL